MSGSTGTRKIMIELPVGIELSESELENLTKEFQGQLVDAKAEHVMVQAKPKEKEKQVPVIVQAKEVAQAKEQNQVV